MLNLMLLLKKTKINNFENCITIRSDKLQCFILVENYDEYW
jgi:hypothetical protein